ncbi:MAG: DUF6470 family protein [Ignavibacteriales bacterium]
MNLLRIEQTYGKIGIDKYPSKLEINSKQANLNMHKTLVQVEINQELPKVIIDQHECFASAGLKNNLELVQEAAEAGRQQALAYTAQKSQEGDRFANIASKENTVAALAKEHSFDQHVFNIDSIPKVRPKIDFVGRLDISFKKGQITNDVEQGYMNMNFSKAQIEMYELQKPSVNIEYIGNNIDLKI